MDMMHGEMEHDAKAMCAKCLTMAFADSYVMYYRAHAFHWNVKGPEFSQFHDFFAMIYEDIYGSVDEFAENIRKLGPDAPSDLGDILAHTAIDEVFVTGDPIEMTTALYAANEVVIASINDAFKAADAADEQGIADFLAGRDNMHKKWRWQMSTIIGADFMTMPGKSDSDQPVVAMEFSVAADQSDSGDSMTAAAKKTGASTPAPKEDRIKGSDENKPDSADGTGKIKFSDKVETSIKNKVEEHNAKAPEGRKATVAMLKAVYRRGAGAYSTSHRPGMSRDQWAMGRVNAFLRLLKSGRPTNSAYTSDNDLLPASHPKSTKKQNSVVASALVPEERDFANAMLHLVAKHGKFDDDDSGVWVGYTSAARNDKKSKGVYCEHCVFYAGGTECMIIAQPVEPEGMCRLAAIPDGVVTEHTKKNETLLASYIAEKELSIDLLPADEYKQPEDAILALTEFSGLGYAAEPAIRASWLRAVRSSENPFERAKNLAEKKYDSVDADLLPATGEGK